MLDTFESLPDFNSKMKRKYSIWKYMRKYKGYVVVTPQVNNTFHIS